MTYRLFCNDKEINVFSTRVSAFPINKVWQGKQRDISQTEMAYFASFDIEKTVSLKVEVCGCDIKSVQIRPLEKNIPFGVEGNFISFSLSEPCQITVEINGYHESLAIFANEPFVYEKNDCDIYFPAGVHNAGLIVPKSNTRVIFDEGALVYGVIYIKDAENVEIIGRGILDSSPYRRNNDTNGDDGHEVTQALKKLDITERDVQYAGAFNAYNCKNLTIDGVIFVDSPLWTFIIRNGCKNVLINNIKIIGQWRYNSDGVDICASEKVVLQNSFIRSFDDCVVVRAPHLDGESGGCSDIVVRNNVLWCDWGKNLEIWSGKIDSVIKNVVFKDNYLIHIAGYAISIDTWYGSESITVENVLYDGVYCEHDEDHLAMQYNETEGAQYDHSQKKGDLDDINLLFVRVGKLGRDLGNQQFDTNIDTSNFDIRYKNISFKNIYSTKLLNNPYYICSDKLSELSNVTIDGIDYKEYIGK